MCTICGDNHHWNNILFGCAFLINESIESFIWLFETFFIAMGGKYPISIFTDQDQAMENAIKEVFPKSQHRLCLWHISQNAKKKKKNLLGFIAIMISMKVSINAYMEI